MNDYRAYTHSSSNNPRQWVRLRRSTPILSLLVISLLLIISQGCYTFPPTPIPQFPIISEPQIGAPTPLDPGQETGISLSVWMAAGVHLTYEWKVDIDGGEIIRGQGSPVITYRAPDKPGTYKISVIVGWNGTIEERAAFVKVGEGSTPTLTPTFHLAAMLTPTPTRTPPATRTTSVPLPFGLRLTAPGHGSTARGNPLELQWQSGALPAGCSFVVRLQHDTSKWVATSPELSTYQWTLLLPEEKYGWWVWKVQVVKRTAQGLSDVATSDEWGFWFSPFGSIIGPGDSPLATPDAGTPTPIIATPVTPGPATPAGPPYPALTIDLSDISGICSEGTSYKYIFIHARGGNGVYTYYWNGSKVAGPTSESYTFEVEATGGAFVGTAKVISGDGQEVEKDLLIHPPECDDNGGPPTELPPTTQPTASPSPIAPTNTPHPLPTDTPTVAPSTHTPSLLPTPVPTPPSKLMVEAEWPERMETKFSRVIRVSLVRTAEQTFVPTVRVSGNTARAATIVPQGTPEVPLRQSYGPHYNAFVVAKLYPDPLQCTPSEPREYQLLGQPRLDWLWNCTATQPGAHYISVSIEIRWEPDTDIGFPKGPSVVWTESLEVEVDQPLIPSPLLGFFSLGSGLLGSVLSAPWVLQRMRDTGGKRRSRVDHSKLRRMLADHFNREELRELCADLCIEYENLPDTLDGMVRELVAYCERHRRIPELLAVAKQQRAELPWPEVTIDD